MRRLFNAAFSNKKHRLLIVLTLFSMCLATFATQMEAMGLAIITNKGPTFFELFAPVENGVLTPSDSVSAVEVERRLLELDPHHTGVVTKEEANLYFASMKKSNFVNRMIDWVNSVIPINNNLFNLAVFLFFIALFKAVTMFVHRFCTRIVAIRVSRDLRQQYFEHIQRLPMSFFQKYNMGTLSSRVVGDSFTVAEAINACMVNYFQTPFTVVSTLTLCFLTNWQLSLIVFIGLPLIMGIIGFISRRVKRVSKQIQKNQETFAAVLIDFLAGIQTVKLFGMEEFTLKKYREQNDSMARLEQKSARYDLSSRPVVHTIGMFFLAATLIIGLYIFQMSIPEVLFFSVLLYTFYEPIKKFAEENSHIQRGLAAAERMQEVMDIRPQIQDLPGSEALTSFDHAIEFDDVWFRYGEEWVLKGVSFRVKKGETVAIVGPTGAGKSTIVQLLPRLYDVQKGEIRIDGKPVTSITQKSLRDQISFVPQRPFLFIDTVAQNIAFGRPFSESQIKAAAVQAHAEEFICKLPKGYETELAEMGKNLSGGQQQRLAIARALVKGAPILVMDEATSSLDNLSEHYIKTSIQQLHGKMTQIIIAHRLTTIEHVDRIIYLEEGRKIAEGTKEELLKTCPSFVAMWSHGKNFS